MNVIVVLQSLCAQHQGYGNHVIGPSPFSLAKGSAQKKRFWYRFVIQVPDAIRINQVLNPSLGLKVLQACKQEAASGSNTQSSANNSLQSDLELFGEHIFLHYLKYLA